MVIEGSSDKGHSSSNLLYRPHPHHNDIHPLSSCLATELQLLQAFSQQRHYGNALTQSLTGVQQALLHGAPKVQGEAGVQLRVAQALLQVLYGRQGVGMVDHDVEKLGDALSAHRFIHIHRQPVAPGAELLLCSRRQLLQRVKKKGKLCTSACVHDSH